MKAPNLFSFATSELSQDAFICWLLSWAKADYVKIDASLHHCALELISAFFKKHAVTLPATIDEIKITKQDSHIDVLCIINNKFAIIIEDKTSTSHHSNQLERYLKEIEKRDYESSNILPIYYKTSDQSNYRSVIKNGYQPFLRKDILELLNLYTGINSILLDYRAYLQNKSERIESYKTLPIKDWHSSSWVGFFIALQVELHKGDWGYVHNEAGGFHGFWWHFHTVDGCKQYIQLECNNKKRALCFKISVNDASHRSKLRNQWYSELKKAGESVLRIKKPDRFGTGKTMTVCILEEDFIVADESNFLDMSETTKRLKLAEKVLSTAHSNVTKTA